MFRSEHGSTFVPAVGPHRDIVRIIEDNYYEDGDGRAVEAELAAREIVEFIEREYGVNLS
jgi:hypothetical protein